MADWNSPLPDTAVVGEATHVEDHNALVAALGEVRTNVDTVDAAAAAAQATADTAPAWGEVTGKPSTFNPATHTHAVGDVTGLQSALDGKQATGSYATAADLAALVARVEALEAPEA